MILLQFVQKVIQFIMETHECFWNRQIFQRMQVMIASHGSHASHGNALCLIGEGRVNFDTIDRRTYAR